MSKYIRLTIGLTLFCLSLQPALWAEDQPIKHVAFIIDDGPHPELGPRMIELFEKEGIKVSFAQVATTMAKHPEITLAQQAAGHEIVNHSHDHRQPKDLSDNELLHEIVGAQKTITGVIGKEPTWYWPPYLAATDRVKSTLIGANMNLYPTPHLVSSDDWNTSVTADQIREKATSNIQDATVILFHEWRQETYEQFPAIIAELKRQNCVFLTFTELQEYHSKKQAAN